MSDREKFKASLNQSDFLKDKTKTKYSLQHKKEALLEILEVMKITISTRQ